MNATGRIRGHIVMAVADVPAPAGPPSADQFITDLKVKLGISDRQIAAWEPFAESLRANRRRMQALADTTDQPFGSLEDRLTARHAMRRAATELFPVLGKLQHQTAMQVLPLCCLPYTARVERNRLADVSKE